MLNTHLTFPHNNAYDPIMRKNQAKKIVSLLQRYPHHAHILAGDFNGSIHDDAVRILLEDGRLSPMSYESDFVTHHSHRGDSMACDLILTSSQMTCGVPIIGPIDDALSDHAMVVSELRMTT